MGPRLSTAGQVDKESEFTDSSSFYIDALSSAFRRGLHRAAPAFRFAFDCRLRYRAYPSRATDGCGKIAAHMAKPAVQFEVACPCCGASLKVDVDSKAVIAHTPKAVPKTFDDIEARSSRHERADSRKESIFRQSVENQKNRLTCWKRSFKRRCARPKKRLTPASRCAISISTKRDFTALMSERTGYTGGWQRIESFFASVAAWSSRDAGPRRQAA